MNFWWCSNLYIREINLLQRKHETKIVFQVVGWNFLCLFFKTKRILYLIFLLSSFCFYFSIICIIISIFDIVLRVTLVLGGAEQNTFAIIVWKEHLCERSHFGLIVETLSNSNFSLENQMLHASERFSVCDWNTSHQIFL